MRCLIVSDIHANLAAFERVLEDASGEYDTVWCLGDIVGYGAEPNECVERLRSLPHSSLVGNHDWAVLGKLDLYAFNTDARAAVQYSAAQLTGASRDYLESLVPYLLAPPFTMAHGSPRHPIWEYVMDAATADANFEVFPTPVCFVGHTHTAMIFRRSRHGDASVAELPAYRRSMTLPGPGGERLIVNPGSVGQPRDADARAAYALLDTDTLAYEPRRVEYDVQRTQDKMRRAGLPSRLITRLEYGW